MIIDQLASGDKSVALDMAAFRVKPVIDKPPASLYNGVVSKYICDILHITLFPCPWATTQTTDWEQQCD
jgi:hypothetical protein